MPLLDRPTLSADEARALLAETREDLPLYAAVSLMLFAGARPGEAGGATVADYEPKSARIWLGQRWGGLRQVRIAPSAARAIDTYLAAQDADPEEPLFLGLQGANELPNLVRWAALRAGVDAGVHSLRQAAIAAALYDGAPVSHIEAYFGIGKWVDPVQPAGVPEGYDAAMARSLEVAFAA
ncbi:tyrosine-type recombinase/integrase [Streptomyces xanthophaeus]|uniref:tyrosine-type recombinase/integrase n=1 Tax=Streptomyces xanthophaeus TaxID=67385 RepID=UPI0039900C57